MKAAVVAIGDELTCGSRLDTNSQAVSRRLTAVPLEVVAHLTVGDSVEAIHTGLRTALGMAEVVVVAGGLGPTEDDLTCQAVAAHFGLGLVEDEGALSDIRQRFARRGRFIERWLGTAMRNVTPLHRIGRIAAPVLLIHGEGDRYMLPSNMDLLYSEARQEHTERLLIPGRGHADVLRDPACGRQIVAFFSRTLSPGHARVTG